MAKLTLAVPVANGQGAAQTWRGGWGTVWCSVPAGGGFDGGTITLQVSYDGGVSYQTVRDDAGADVTFAAAGHAQIAYSDTPLLRTSLAGSSGATAILLTVHYGQANARLGVPNFTPD